MSRKCNLRDVPRLTALNKTSLISIRIYAANNIQENIWLHYSLKCRTPPKHSRHHIKKTSFKTGNMFKKTASDNDFL